MMLSSFLCLVTAFLPLPSQCKNSNYISDKTDTSLQNLGGTMENELAAIFRDVAYGEKIIDPQINVDATKKSMPDYIPPPTTNIPALFEHIYIKDNNNSTDTKGFTERPGNVSNTKSNINLTLNYPNAHAADSVTSEKCDSDRALKNLHAKLGITLDIHIYLSGILYSIIGMFIFFCIISLLLSHKYTLVIYAIVIYLTTFLATFFRMIQLFYDPYFLGNKLPVYLSDAISGVSLYIPFVGLAVLISILLRVAHLKLIFLSLQFSTIGSIAITILVIIVIIVELLVAILGSSTLVVLRTCIYVLLCACIGAVCVSYVVVYARVKDAVLKKRDTGRLGIYVTDAEINLNENVISRLISATNLALSSVILGIFITGLAVFSLSLLPHKLIMSHQWTWLAVQSTQNIFEVVMWSCSCISAFMVMQMCRQSSSISTIYSYLPCFTSQSPPCTNNPLNYKTNGPCSSPRTYYAVCSKPFPTDTLVFLDSSYKPNTQILPSNSANINCYTNNRRRQEFIPFLKETANTEDSIYNEIEEYSNNYINEANCRERGNQKLGEPLFAFRS